jgi:hypothetical protein
MYGDPDLIDPDVGTGRRGSFLARTTIPANPIQSQPITGGTVVPGATATNSGNPSPSATAPNSPATSKEHLWTFDEIAAKYGSGVVRDLTATNLWTGVRINTVNGVAISDGNFANVGSAAAAIEAASSMTKTYGRANLTILDGHSVPFEIGEGAQAVRGFVDSFGDGYENVLNYSNAKALSATVAPGGALVSLMCGTGEPGYYGNMVASTLPSGSVFFAPVVKIAVGIGRDSVGGIVGADDTPLKGQTAVFRSYISK